MVLAVMWRLVHTVKYLENASPSPLIMNNFFICENHDMLFIAVGLCSYMIIRITTRGLVVSPFSSQPIYVL